MTHETKTLNQSTRVANRFVRAINIERDLPDPDSLRGYRLTSRGEQALTRILSGLQCGSTQRAWRLTGPYGGGKSSLALLIASSFLHRFSRRHASGKLLHGRAPHLHVLGGKTINYRPIVLQGHYDDVSIALANRLLEALGQMRTSAARTKLTQALKRFVKARRTGAVAADSVLRLLDQFTVLEQRSTSPFDGVLLIVDELGRFLDYAAVAETDLDAGFFQALAERCAGERDVNTAVIGILHQRFEDYARSSAIGDRLLEWRKVAERFEEVTLEESVDGSLMLMAEAITTDVNSLSVQTAKAAVARVDLARKWGLLPSELADSNATALFPLHPSTALALSVLSRRLGQTERSVFSFLMSQDVGGFQAFLDSRTPTPETVFRLSDLCDYLMAHGIALVADAERSKRWAMLQDSLRGAPLHNDLELNVLKSIGVLNLLEPLPSIDCTLEQVSFAVLDETNSRAVGQAVESLIQRNVVFIRRATSELCVWPRSSVDLAREYRRTKPQVGEIRRLDDLIQKLPTPRPIVAHRHYIRTGTLRTLSVRVAPHIDAIANLDSESTLADGNLYIVPVYPDQNAADVDAMLRQTSEELPQGTVLAARALDQEMLDAAKDIQVWEAVKKACSDLRVDAIARDEVDDSIARARADLNRGLTGFLSFSEPDAEIRLFYQGEVISINDSAALSQWVSLLMDSRFSAAPVFHNELINRVTISTQAATARSRLLAAMLGQEHAEDLGIRKTPPEKAIFRTLFQASGMHRSIAGQWQFIAPEENISWSTCWHAVETALSGSEPVVLHDVIKQLMKPPIGLRETPALVLCVAVLIANRFKLALREEGTFITELTTAHLGRMAKSPARFDARLLPATKANTALLAIYQEVFLPDQENADIGDILRALFRWYLSLPSFTLQTKSLSKPPRVLLNSISKAGDPISLLHSDVPDALGINLDAGPTAKQVNALKRSLQKHVTAIDQALPTLVREVHRAACAAFGLTSDTSLLELRRHIRKLCELAGPMPNEPNVSALRLRTIDSQRNDQQWLESVANLLTGQQVGSWEDGTLHMFDASITRLASLLERVVVLAKTANDAGSDPLSLIGVHIVDATGRDRMFTVNTQQRDSQGCDVYKAIRAAIADVADPQRVLAQLLSEYAMTDTTKTIRPTR